MPPVLTMSSSNYDYDYDTVQPYFLLDGEEEDFYAPPRSQLLPGPGEDIWKKFELLPTPPLSPSRTASSSSSDVSLSAADHLEAVSALLDEDGDASEAFLQSFIIQDCMWSSSFAAATKLEQVVSERLAMLRRARHDSNANQEETAAVAKVGGAQVNKDYLQDLHAMATTDCIDPSVVFPYTGLSEKTTAEIGGSEVCLDTPPPSCSDSESEEEEEGEEEEEEEEEEEDEEIDVVTVDRRRKSSRRPEPSSSPSPPLVLKRSHISIHQHNYAAQQPEPPAVKRLKADVAVTVGNGRRCCSPRSDGGEDGEDRRRTHNVLERQRRSELKTSFLALRDQVPAVANNDKAAKVVILKKAAAFVTEIREDERRLLEAKDELRKRSRELKQRLEQLRTLH